MQKIPCAADESGIQRATKKEISIFNASNARKTGNTIVVLGYTFKGLHIF